MPSEKIWVFKYFRQKLAGGKLSAAENFTLGQLGRCEGSYAKTRGNLHIRLQRKSVKVKRSGQWEISNLFRKKSKFSAFCDENWPENYFWQKPSQHTAQLNDAPSINAKILAFRSLL